MKQPQRAARHDGGLRLGRFGAGALETAGDHGVDSSVDGFDPADAGIGQFTGEISLRPIIRRKVTASSSHRSLVLIPVGFLVSSPGD